jgi:hypothetical protein
MLDSRFAFLLVLIPAATLVGPVIAATNLTQMYVSPRIVQVGVETEITIGYGEKPHMEGQVWVEGKVIRGYLPTFHGAGVSVVRYRATDRGGGELALEWRAVIKPTEVGSINVVGRDETGATHVDSIQVLQELPPPLFRLENNQTATYVVPIFVIVVASIMLLTAFSLVRNRRRIF